MFGSQDEHVLETLKGCPVGSPLSMADEGRCAVNQESLCSLSAMIIPCGVGHPLFQRLTDCPFSIFWILEETLETRFADFSSICICN